jgi:hypothetical protein
MVGFRLQERAEGLLIEREGALFEELAARRMDPYRAAELLLRRIEDGSPH